MSKPNKELNDMIEVVAFEKNMPVEMVRGAMETAIAGLARKENKAPDGKFEVKISANGGIEVNRVWTYVEEVINPDAELSVDGTAFEVGQVIKQSAEVPKWTRQGLQTVKQILAQKIKQGLRDVVADEWTDKVGTCVLGMIKKVDRDRAYIEFGNNAEGVIEGRDRIPREFLRAGTRIRSYVKSVAAGGRGPVIHLSRAAPELLEEIVGIEVPEVGSGQIKIRGVAREAGVRAKVLVESLSYHGKSSPAAICAGTRGVRAQAISNELNGERVDFIEWSDNDAQLILNSMAPAEIVNIVLDNDKKTARLGVEEARLAIAIGSRGQNVRLASKVTGWNIEVMTVDDLKKKRYDEDEAAKQEFMELLEVDRDVAELLVEEGFFNVEDVAMASIAELTSLPGVDEETAEALNERAIEAAELKSILHDNAGDDWLGGLEGVTEDDLARFETQNVKTLQDLADLATDELEWPENDDRLGGLIIQARKKVGMI